VPFTRSAANIGAIAFAILGCVPAVGCDERRLPTEPDRTAAAITIEAITASVRTGRTARPVQPGFIYGVSLLLRETAGVGGAISQITATLRDISGTSTETQLSPVDAFGTTRFSANGVLPAKGMFIAGPVPSNQNITIHVAFIDEHLNAGSAQASLSLNADVSGEWIGGGAPLFPGDWYQIRVVLLQRDDNLSGEVITRDGLRFPLSGCFRCDWAPQLSISGLPTHSGGCAVGFNLTEFGFGGGQLRSLVVQYSGRCPGTTFGTFELQRTG
jgi:hypothetical protein